MDDQVIDKEALTDRPIRIASLHSRVMPDLALKVTWPANTNSLIEAYLEMIALYQFNLLNILSALPEIMRKEKKASGTSLCKITMYVHMVHSIMHQTGTPNRLTQANDLAYMTNTSLVFRDQEGKFDPERLVPNAIFKASQFIEIQQIRVKQLHPCPQKDKILEQKNGDDILVTWKTRSTDPSKKCFSYFSKSRDHETTREHAQSLWQQIQQGCVETYRQLINYETKQNFTDEHLPPKDYGFKIEYSDGFQQHLARIRSECGDHPAEMQKEKIEGAYYFQDVFNVDIKQCGQKIIDLYKEIHPKIMDNISEISLKYIHQIDYNYMTRVVNQIQAQESEFNKSYMNIAVNQHILQQQINTKIHEATGSLVGNFQALHISISFISDYDKPQDEFALVRRYNNRMNAQGANVPILRHQSSVSSMLPSKRSLGVMNPSILEGEIQNSQFGHSNKTVLEYNFTLIDGKSIFAQIEDAVWKEEINDYTKQTQVANKAQKAIQRFRTCVFQGFINNMLSKVETSDQKYVAMQADIYDEIVNKHIEVPVLKVKQLKSLLEHYTHIQNLCCDQPYTLSIKRNPLKLLINLNHQIAQFLLTECELTEVVQMDEIGSQSQQQIEAFTQEQMEEINNTDMGEIFVYNFDQSQIIKRQKILDEDEERRKNLPKALLDNTRDILGLQQTGLLERNLNIMRPEIQEMDHAQQIAEIRNPQNQIIQLQQIVEHSSMPDTSEIAESDWTSVNTSVLAQAMQPVIIRNGQQQ